MASLKLVLDQRRKRKDGLYPLVIRLSHQSSTRDFPTQVKLKPSQFNARRGIIKSDLPLNIEMQKLLLSYSETVRKTLKQNPSIDIQKLKDQVLRPKVQETTIKEFWEAEIKRLIDSNRASGARVYKGVLSALSSSMDVNVPFSQFTLKELRRLELTLYKKGMTINGIGVYMRTLRAICNKAIKDELVGYDWYPFRGYKVKTQRTVSRALSLEDMEAYFGLGLDETHSAYKSWRIGKLIFLLRGINLKDLLLLTDKNIVGDRLHYRRAKTGTLYSIELLEETKHILLQGNKPTLLGRITQRELDKPELLVKRCMQNRKVINKHLTSIGKELNLSIPLTTYCFRHTWASLCRKMGYSKELIAQGLGHSSRTVTDTYLEQFDQELVDKMNRDVVSLVM